MLTVRRIITVKLSSMLSKSFGLCVPIVVSSSELSRDIFCLPILMATIKNKFVIINNQNKGK